MNKNHGYAIGIIGFSQQESGSGPRVLAADHVDESEPKLVQTAVRQQRRREIRRQWKTLVANLHLIPLARVDETKTRVYPGRVTKATELYKGDPSSAVKPCN